MHIDTQAGPERPQAPKRPLGPPPLGRQFSIVTPVKAAIRSSTVPHTPVITPPAAPSLKTQGSNLATPLQVETWRTPAGSAAWRASVTPPAPPPPPLPRVAAPPPPPPPP